MSSDLQSNTIAIVHAWPEAEEQLRIGLYEGNVTEKLGVCSAHVNPATVSSIYLHQYNGRCKTELIASDSFCIIKMLAQTDEYEKTIQITFRN